jgi:single-stranded-DNA-specific exonuclease
VAQASHFGFSIGPRINAAGRIGHARLAFDLLTSDDPVRVEQLAGRLHDLNGARQGVEREVLAEAVRAAEAAGGREADTPLVVAGDGWHAGVIGIVASRLKERFGRPAIVIGWDGEAGKGSGRSIGGVDLGAAIGAAAKAGVIEGGGGHPMAAGLSLARAQLADFEAFLTEELGAATAVARRDRTLSLDGALPASALCRTLCETIGVAGPFGNGNPEPRFALEAVRVRHVKIVGERHVSATVQDRMGRQVRTIAFGAVGEPLGTLLQGAADGQAVHLAGRIKPDDWRGGEAAQFQIEDGALAAG